jgi:hypothetical protein
MECKHHEKIEECIETLKRNDEKQWAILDKLRRDVALIVGGIAAIQFVATIGVYLLK